MNGDLPAAGRNSEVIARLRRMSRERSSPAVARPLASPAGQTDRCDLCGTDLPPDHRHLLNTTERTILCSCEPCWAMRAADKDLRPTGTRTVVLEEFALPDDLWARFNIPIGLAFFFHSEVAGGVIAQYPSPAGATESELHLGAWTDLETENPILRGLEPEVEALVVNRLADPHEHAIVPIDRCYELVGMIKAGWEGISGGDAVENAVAAFFADLRARSGV